MRTFAWLLTGGLLLTGWLTGVDIGGAGGDERGATPSPSTTAAAEPEDEGQDPGTTGAVTGRTLPVDDAQDLDAAIDEVCDRVRVFAVSVSSAGPSPSPEDQAGIEAGAADLAATAAELSGDLEDDPARGQRLEDCLTPIADDLVRLT